MGFYVFALLAAALVTEAITELVIKSEIFKPFREIIFKLGSWFEKLFTCGYCFSVWAALLVVLVFPATVLHVSDIIGVDMGIAVLIIHRLSNVIHNITDKWTDKYYDLRYINTDKS
jgi:hypothetical protein